MTGEQLAAIADRLTPPSARWIAHAPTDLAALLAEVRRLRAQLANHPRPDLEE